MGVFDELRCEYPLPDGFLPGPRLFQTKDTPHQWLERYVLQTDGGLIHAATGERLDYHGALRFEATNICGSGPQGVCTDNDQPPWHAAYVAWYRHGTLLALVGGCAYRTARPHFSRAAFARAEEP